MRTQATRKAVAPCKTNEAMMALRKAHEHLGLPRKERRGERRRSAGTCHVPSALVEDLVTTSGRHPGIFPITFDGERVREQLRRVQQLQGMLRMADWFAQEVRDAIREERGAVGASALAAYAMVKAIARVPEGACLLESAERMTRLMKRGRRAA